MNGWTKACVVTALMIGATGCQLIQGPGQRYAYRPSAIEDAADVRLLETPDKPSRTPALAVVEDAIVRVVGPSMTCTGTLIEAGLVLTAHHCVVERGSHGEFLSQALEPSSIRIELGGGYFAWGEVGVRHIVAPPCGEAGGAGDLAILVLTRTLTGLATMSPRTESPPKIGEEAFPIGFGRCALSGDAIRRKGREGGPIRAVQNDTLQMDAAICPGDSGGPVFAKGGREIIGVVSLSAMDHDERTRGASVMARIDSYRSVFLHAQMLADGRANSQAELPPLECNPVVPPSQSRPSR